MNEEIIINLLERAREIVEKYENKYLGVEEKKVLRIELEKVRNNLVDIHNNRLTDLININETLDDLPEEEYKVQGKMTDLIVKINELINAN